MWWTSILGFGLGFGATALATKLFYRWNLLDFPERYGLDRAKIPYPGGLVFLPCLLFLCWIDWSFWIVVLPALILGILSFIDDRRPIDAKWRLLVHVWLALFVWIMGVRIYYISNPFGGTNFEITHIYPYFALGLTVFWIIAIQNASNWFDGLKGLSVGISGIGFLTLALLGLIRPELLFDASHSTLTLANFYLAGLALGAFWWYWRGKIILGDTGSQVLGFLLAVMSIYAGAKIATTLLVLSLPILDFFWVIFRRMIIEKRSPLKGDKRHFHHLLARVVGDKIAVVLCLLFSALFGAVALFFSGEIKLYAFIGLAGLFLLTSVGLYKKNKASKLV